MKATIEIKKSFDATTEFSKEWIANDFETFLKKKVNTLTAWQCVQRLKATTATLGQ